jgi:hypothetical protein
MTRWWKTPSWSARAAKLLAIERLAAVVVGHRGEVPVRTPWAVAVLVMGLVMQGNWM